MQCSFRRGEGWGKTSMYDVRWMKEDVRCVMVERITLIRSAFRNNVIKLF